MDFGWPSVVSALVVGWLGKDLLASEGRVESVGAPCTCVCKCASEAERWTPLFLPLLLLGLICLGLLGLILFRSASAEQPIPRKGKGVFGQSGRTLQLTQ